MGRVGLPPVSLAGADALQLPASVRARLAENILDPVEVEGVAVRAAFDLALPGAIQTVSVAWFGADSSGAADSTAAFNAALRACPPGGKVIVPAGTYKLSGELNNLDMLGQPKSLNVSAYGATFIQTSPEVSVDFSGGWEPTVPVSAVSAVTITEAAVDKYGTRLTVTGTMPWKRGDVVKVWADDILPESQWDISPAPSSAGRVGQFFTVHSVAANEVTLQGKLRDPMTTGIRAARMLPVCASWAGGVFDVSDGYLAGGYTQPTFRFTAMRAPSVKDVRVARAGGSAFSMVSNLGYRLENCEANWAWDDPDTSHYGYGVDDNSSWFGVVDGCRFFQSRHGYTTTASATTVGQDAPNIHGRTFSARVVDTTTDSSSNSAFDTHSNGDSISFQNCVAINARFGFTLRGSRHSVLNGTVRDCRGAVRFATDSVSGESFGHVIDGLRVEGTTESVFEAMLRHGGTHPNAGVRDARPLIVRNVHARNVQGKAWTLKNATVVADDVLFEFSGPVAAVGSTIDLSRLQGSSHRYEVFDTTGSGMYLFDITDTDSHLEVSRFRVAGYSTMATRVSRVINAGAAAVVRVDDLLVDYAPSDVVHTPTSNAGWVTWRVGVGSNQRSSAYYNSTSATASLAFLAKQDDPVTTIVFTLASNQTLANLVDVPHRGRVLVIVNASASSALTVAHGTTPKTALTGAANKVLSAGQSLMLVYSDSGVWRQVTPV